MKRLMDFVLGGWVAGTFSLMGYSALTWQFWAGFIPFALIVLVRDIVKGVK